MTVFVTEPSQHVVGYIAPTIENTSSNHTMSDKDGDMVHPPDMKGSSGLGVETGLLQILSGHNPRIGDAENDTAIPNECQTSVSIANISCP